MKKKKSIREGKTSKKESDWGSIADRFIPNDRRISWHCNVSLWPCKKKKKRIKAHSPGRCCLFFFFPPFPFLKIIESPSKGELQDRDSARTQRSACAHLTAASRQMIQNTGGNWFSVEMEWGVGRREGWGGPQQRYN